MKNRKQTTKKSLLVLGAMTTLSAQLSTELTLLAYAASTPQSTDNTTYLDASPQTGIKPSISKIEHYYGAFRTYDTIRFGVWTQTNGGSNIASTEWSTDGLNWNTFSHTVDVQFTTAGDHTLYLRTTNEDGVVSDIYEYPLTVVEATAPEILELYFEEDELFVGGDYEPYYEIKYEEGTAINHFVWGGDYDTMFDSPGEKTITLRVQDSRGLWSNEMSHTFTVQPAQPSSPVVQPSIYQIEHYYGAFRTYDTIRFGVRVQDNGTPAIVSNEWSINGVNWTPFTHTIDVKFVTAGEQALYLRSHYEDGTVSNIYEYPLTITEATAPEISELMFEESDLYVGANFEPTYLIKHEEGTVINHFVWGGDYDTMFDSPGEKTITLKVQDNRGLWSNEASYTFTVREAKAPVIQGVIPSANEYYEGDTIHFDYQVDYDTDASFQTIEWLSGYPLSNQVGTHQVTFRVQDNRGLWSDPFTYTYEVKQLVKPTLTFTGSTLTVDYGKTPNFNQGAVLNHGTATNVRYEVVKDSFNSKKLGKQNVKYRVSYEQSGKTYQFEVTRPVEVKAVDPTLTFSKTTLTAKYGSSLSYKTGVTVSNGSATDVTYTLVKDSYNPKKLGKQTVKYQLSYTQNGKKYTKTINRTIEVTPVNPTLTFSDTVLKVKYGSDLSSSYKTGVKISSGSATNIKYSVVKDTFNPKKLGKQKVKYLVTFEQNGVKQRDYVYRTVEVTAVNPTLTFDKTTLKVKYGSNLDYKKGVKLSKGSATDVKYSLVKNSFNPKKVGKQTVKYELSYKQNGKKYTKTISRTVEVIAVKPTLTFPKTTLTVKYGKTPDFKAGVKVNKGSATDVKYSVVKGSFNPKKRGTQKVKYQLTYKQSGKSYKTIVERTVKVK